MFQLGSASLKNLEGMHSDLVQVVQRAIQLTQVDFRVNEGLRSVERQKELVAAGASQTMKSRHLTGHAVDLVPLIGGYVRWDWPLFDQIAEAMLQATKESGVPLIWGAAWKRDFLIWPSAEEAKLSYIDECRKAGRKPFMDGPHFELSISEYPL